MNLLKIMTKSTVSSFKVKDTSLWWKDTTMKNISECFCSFSKLKVSLGDYAIQVDHNGKQLAVALLDIANTFPIK